MGEPYQYQFSLARSSGGAKLSGVIPGGSCPKYRPPSRNISSSMSSQSPQHAEKLVQITMIKIINPSLFEVKIMVPLLKIRYAKVAGVFYDLLYLQVIVSEHFTYQIVIKFHLNQITRLFVIRRCR